MRIDRINELVRKELSLFFSSPIGYLFLAGYLGVTLFVFFWVETFFAQSLASVRSMFEWVPILLIFLAAALTMRSWSDERRTGTIEFVTTLPATLWELVLGKFVACVVLLCIALALTLPLPISVAVMGNLDWGPVVAGYIASLLLGATYISVGVFVSSRSENQIVSLILTTFVCGLLYLVGSPFLTAFVDNNVADVLRQLGSGSRFDSITRGVIDFRDLAFYITIAASFLALNVFSLQHLGWAKNGDKSRHQSTALITTLLIANLLCANVWLGFVKVLRWDVTEGNLYSVSAVTEQQLEQLTEPLLVRGYFSAKTHPLLAPLVPELKDLLAEYEVIGGDRIRLEIVDPTLDPEVEDEAQSKYGIRPQPFQIEDRHEASLVNSYFNVLVSYGDEWETLNFRDLIEVKAESETDLSVFLGNPEYVITRAIKKVLSGFQGGGSTFDFIADPLTFTGYVSADESLPIQLADARQPLTDALAELEEESAGKFSWQLVDPQANDGAVAQQIATDYGFQPMVSSLFDSNQFYFYMTVTDGQTVLSLSVPETRDKAAFRRGLEEALQRFAKGLLSTVGISTPAPSAPQNPYMPQQQPSGSQFTDLDAYLSNDFDVESIDLQKPVPSHVDVLLVVGPERFDDKQVFSMDQFLMRGGTVVVAAGAFSATQMQQMLIASTSNSGVDDWLDHHGVEIQRSMVLDSNNAKFPMMVTRSMGVLSFQEIRMIDYPFFVDVQADHLPSDTPITNTVNQLTMAYSSPLVVDVDVNADRVVTELIRTSNGTWTQESPDIHPKVAEDGSTVYTAPAALSSQLLGVLLEGRFSSPFTESPMLAPPVEEESEDAESEADVETLTLSDFEAAENDASGSLDDEAAEDGETEEEEEEDPLVVSGVINLSPESAKLLVIGSSEFLADNTIRRISQSQAALYSNTLELVANVVDFSTEDASLMSIRGRGHFNRRLPPLTAGARNAWEFGNYAFALLAILIVFGINYQLRQRRLAQFKAALGG